MKNQVKEPHYLLKLSERQVKLLSYTCDLFSRLICGQDESYQELMEEAWERRSKEATGDSMDNEWDGGWYAMRHDAEEICKKIKKRFWGLEANALYGVKYDDTADILFDLHQVLRHQLWLDRPESEKTHMTVDSDAPMRFGSEPLASIKKDSIKMDKVEKIKDEIERRKSLADKQINDYYFFARSDAYAELLNFIGSLEEEPDCIIK